MLVASILKYGQWSDDILWVAMLIGVDRIFYWFGAYYSNSLLIQACLMVVVQLILLKVALDNRPPIGAKHEYVPFSEYSAGGTLQSLISGRRPYDFWQWPNGRPLVQKPLQLRT